MKHKAVTTILSMLAVGGGATGTTYTVVSNSQTQENTTVKPALQTKTFTFKFGEQVAAIECPLGSHPDESLDFRTKPNKLAIYCQRREGPWRQIHEQNKVFNWEYMFSYKGTRPVCTTTDMTVYQCTTPQNLKVEEVKDIAVRRDAAAVNWIRIG
ncbi:hypothetical protein MHLP_03015 [Candidatus Mycoplasma haematolamae str. Purdue]|uniref:Uncharacterized protein n=1 Tax=Mycoplasma haematolamae (strain Purdue) TaxID=1212765 RepID=I7BJY7_MYCHA|nr:hypothetical protein [Candidatus Mycoplasma haematolamae]AFO52183.1 hypothetical protein MHLP_03015 [Candidatus Mycoplasma haematolamae str. Purdue]